MSDHCEVGNTKHAHHSEEFKKSLNQRLNRIEVTEKAKFAGKKVADAHFPDWLRPAFIKRQSLSGSWNALEPRPDELLLENDRVVVFCLKEKISEAQKRFKV